MKLTKLSENLYLLRKRRGLSQEEFAEKIHISRQAVSKWERGEAYPDTENLIEIAAFYGVTLDELVNSTDACEAKSRAEADEDETKSCEEAGGCVKDAEGDASETSTAGRAGADADADILACDAEDGEKQEKGMTVEGKLHFNWYDLPYPVVITAVYLALGFLTPRGWEIWWTLFVTIPIYYSVVDCIRKRRLSPFAYPVFTAFAYLFVGVCFGIWHPTWIIFVTIPVFYPIADGIDKRREGKSSGPS